MVAVRHTQVGEMIDMLSIQHAVDGLGRTRTRTCGGCPAYTGGCQLVFRWIVHHHADVARPAYTGGSVSWLKGGCIAESVEEGCSG